MLEIKNITKSYKKNTVLRDVNIKITPGRIVGITGRNGSGKTTLIKCLMGHLNTEKKGEIKSYAYLDDYSELFQMPLNDTIQFYRNIYPDFDYDKFISLASIMKIDLKRNKVESMSFGEKKKAKLALVLSRNVSVYFLDEPFSEVDIFSIDEIIEAIISSIDLEKSTVFIVDHNVEVLEKMIDDIIFISNSKIHYYEDIEQIKSENGKSLVDLYTLIEGEEIWKN